MLSATKEEQDEITAYYLSQSSTAKINFLQKIYSESVIGCRHDVWDVHASDGRWWIITNPTNLYSQEQFPSMDLAVTFHMGLCLRIPRTQEQNISNRDVRLFSDVFIKLRESSDALSQAKNVADYQAIGMRSREALLALVGAAQGVAVWSTTKVPKRADFRAWNDLICNAALTGRSQKERRRLLKNLLTESWVFANWLTHAQSATWHDAEAAQSTIEHAIGLATSLILRYIKSVPDECPNCGCPHLYPEEGMNEELPEIIWERPACGDCGWTGTPIQLGTLYQNLESEGMITHEGDINSGKCITPSVPLVKLNKPGDV